MARVCVGRHGELQRARRHVVAAAQGRGGLVLVRGPVGIGKTTLARACMDEATVAGGSAHFLAATGPELETPLGIWARLAASAGWTTVTPRGERDHVHPHARYGAVVALLRALAPAPVVVVIDDLHQADESSLTTLAQVAPVLPAMGVLVLATWRAAPGDAPPVFDALDPWADTFDLDRFGVDAVREMLEMAAGDGARAWAAAVAPILHDRSGGNPLVLQAIVDDLGIGTGARPAAHEIASMPLQRAVGDVLGARLGALPEGTLDVLQVMALVGGDVQLALVEEVLDRPAAGELAAALHAGVLEPRPHGGYGFFHPVLAELVVERRADELARWRRRIADNLRRRGRAQDLQVVAHHLAEAGPFVTPAELELAALDAAEQAWRVGDHASAARNFDLALDSAGDLDRVDVLLRSAAAHHVAGHRRTGWERAREAARLAGDSRPVELARAALAFARERRYTTEQAEAVELLRRALDTLGDDDPLRREVLASCALLEMSAAVPSRVRDLDRLPAYDAGDGDATQTQVAWNWVHRPDVARAMADEALDLARATGDEDLVARVMTPWRQTHCAPEFLDVRLANSDHAMRHARRPEDRVQAAVASVLDNLEDGRRPAVDRALAELVGLAAATGDPAVRWRTGQLAAMLAFASGRPHAARRHTTEAFAYGAQAGENGRWVVRAVQTTLLSAEVEPDAAPTVDFLLANVDELVYPPIRAGAVFMLARLGRVAEASRHLPALVAHLAEDTGREASWLVTGAMAADAVAAVGEAELAAGLLDVLAPFADRIAVDGIGFHCHGCLARPLARLAELTGQPDLAATLRTQGLARDSAAGLRRWVLDGGIDVLAARHAAGEIHAAELRGEASALADEANTLGLLRTAGRARGLVVGGGTPELTPRQHDVLLALADGHTYQSAAEKLGFSHSTIRHEAMRVYAALGVRSRAEALDVARELGLLLR
jgi:DNA-binding CsgD family transcriptional regulator